MEVDVHRISDRMESFYRFVIDSLPIAVVTVNSDLRITGFNPWAEHLTGYPEAEALGKHCGEILRGERCETDCPLKAVFESERPVLRLETTIKNKWGGMIPISMNTAGLYGGDGHLVGGLEAFQDISRLKELEREKHAFISMFAHDIKSSLVIIGGFAVRLLTKGTGLEEKEQKKYLEIIKGESSKLEFLINDFLEFSRLKAGELKLNISATSIDKMLAELIEAYQDKALQSGIKLELRNDEIIPVIGADAKRLERVFRNLLDNALKFSNEGGTIAATTHETSEDVIVEITDQGIGIDPKSLPYIFDAFRRGQRSQRDEGFGLGLATVKTIVEAHGGRVRVESELDKGSTFAVVLPKVRESDKGTA
jgi:PAS domain S-box-containing protein